MAISPRLGLVPAGEPEFSQDSPGCVYSFDLDGNVIEMNAAMAGRLGYARDEATHMNLAQLVEPESWKNSREQILVQLGGGGPQLVSLTAIARDGSHVRLAVLRRLLFERGRPVAVQDSGPVLDHPEAGSSPTGYPDHQISGESSRFAEQLKQLHRLSTTNYATLDQALRDHLETGCRLFHLPVGVLLQVEGDNGVIQASHGAERKAP